MAGTQHRRSLPQGPVHHRLPRRAADLPRRGQHGLVRERLRVGEDGESSWPLPSFVGTLTSGRGNVAARSQEILRAEMGRDAR